MSEDYKNKEYKKTKKLNVIFRWFLRFAFLIHMLELCEKTLFTVIIPLKEMNEFDSLLGSYTGNGFVQSMFGSTK